MRLSLLAFQPLGVGLDITNRGPPKAAHGWCDAGERRIRLPPVLWDCAACGFRVLA